MTTSVVRQQGPDDIKSMVFTHFISLDPQEALKEALDLTWISQDISNTRGTDNEQSFSVSVMPNMSHVAGISTLMLIHCHEDISNIITPSCYFGINTLVSSHIGANDILSSVSRF